MFSHNGCRGFAWTLRIVAALSLLTGAIATAQPPAAAPSPNNEAAQRLVAENNKLPDPTGTGRFPAMKEEVASLPKHVVYRPANLDALGTQKLGVVAWGNGGCSNDGASSRFHLLEIASHGYLVLASGQILSGPGAPPAEPRAPAQPGQPAPPRTLASDLTDAIDWALAENARAGSPYRGRIDTAQIAVSGWSCGGLQALRVANDPRVRAVVLHNTGVLNGGPNTTLPGMDLTKDALANLHTPVIYIMGGPTDIAYPNGMDDYARITHVPAAIANLPVGHGGTFQQPNGGAAASVAVSWLDWQLRDDAQAAKRFVGNDCGLCKDGSWTFERKNFTSADPNAKSFVPVEQAPYHVPVFSNDYATVLNVFIPPQRTSGFHRHALDTLVVRLSDGERTNQVLGATATPVVLQPVGAVNFLSYGREAMVHSITMANGKPLHNIVVQLSSTTPYGLTPGSRDGVAGYTQVLDNERLRVWRLALEPGEQAAAITQRAPGIRVVVAGGEILERVPGNPDRGKAVHPAEFYWQEPGVTRAVHNTGTTRVELVEIELK